MIRALARDDHDALLSYLRRDPLNNIHVIHAVEAGALEKTETCFWGDFEGGKLDGVLLVAGEGVLRAAHPVGDHPEAAARLGKHALELGVRSLIGKKPHVELILKTSRIRDSIVLKRLVFYTISPGSIDLRRDHAARAATQDDVPLLVELYRDYEFNPAGMTDEEIARDVRDAMDSGIAYFVLEEDGRIACGARVFPETEHAGMIGAARTLPEYRGRGLYLSVRTACLEHLFRQQKTAVGSVLDTNTRMLRVLEKQGGAELSEWLLAEFKPRQPLRRRILPLALRRWMLRTWRGFGQVMTSSHPSSTIKANSPRSRKPSRESALDVVAVVMDCCPVIQRLTSKLSGRRRKRSVDSNRSSRSFFRHQRTPRRARTRA